MQGGGHCSPPLCWCAVNYRTHRHRVTNLYCCGRHHRVRGRGPFPCAHQRCVEGKHGGGGGGQLVGLAPRTGALHHRATGSGTHPGHYCTGRRNRPPHPCAPQYRMEGRGSPPLCTTAQAGRKGSGAGWKKIRANFFRMPNPPGVPPEKKAGTPCRIFFSPGGIFLVCVS